MQQLKKYKQNLSLVELDNDTYVKSYSTLVAKIEGDNIRILGWWSQTTSKHINYVAKQLNKQVIK
jgi:hypothetical protein